MSSRNVTRATLALLVCAWSASAAATHLPIVRIWETPNALGGAYTVSVDSTQSANQWRMYAFAVTNNDATGVLTERTGWSADLISESDWDAGRTYSQFGPFGSEFPWFTTGSGGVGSFDQALGLTHHQAAVYWLESHSGMGLGPNSTSSQFFWLDGPPSSTALVLLQSGGLEAFMSCDLDTGANCTAFNPTVVPLPAAAWLFISSLAGLGIVGRRRRLA